jgi:nicotinamide-nucleotide amidase
MATTLVVVGKSLKLNKAFLDYIDAQVYLHVKTPEKKIFLDKSNKDLFLIMENVMREPNQTIIAAATDSFNLIGKVISTISEDVLELKDTMLIPSKVQEYTEKSYVFEYEGKKINVIEAKENFILPDILIDGDSESEIFSLIGVDEDSTKILLNPLADTYEIKLTSTSIVEGWNAIEATTNKYGNLENFFKSVKSLFPDKFIRNSNVVAHIIESLETAGETVSVAESCTGGKIAAMITCVAGSSSVFNGSIISYSNEIKKSWLGVSDVTLQKYGAVSELCIREMLEGVLNASSGDYAMATSGIAGPTGGSLEKPVGTVFVGARSKDGDITVERLLLQGDREYIQEQSAYHAFRLLLAVGKNLFFKK